MHTEWDIPMHSDHVYCTHAKMCIAIWACRMHAFLVDDARTPPAKLFPVINVSHVCEKSCDFIAHRCSAALHGKLCCMLVHCVGADSALSILYCAEMFLCHLPSQIVL